MNEIIFSIIIPHKDIPSLLQRCLDSIPRREDIQIIVVDDNSDENKVDFSKFSGLDDRYVEIYLNKRHIRNRKHWHRELFFRTNA